MREITKKGLIVYYAVSIIAIVLALVLMEMEKDSGYFSGFLIGAGPVMFVFALVYHGKYYRKFKRFF